MKSKYDQSIFINCPFTKDYEPIFKAIVFAITDCGFIARCALERKGSLETRIEKITRIISECRYGIHDISVIELDPDYKLPRFNMPFELGVFYGASKLGSGKQRRKACIVLDSQRDRYRIFFSDISGQDPEIHNNNPKTAIEVVRNWLKGELHYQKIDDKLPSGNHIFQRFKAFTKILPLVCKALKFESVDIPYNDFTNIIEEWRLANP